VYPSDVLLRWTWGLRSNVTSSDGCSIALAEALGVPLVTADRCLADAPGIRCEVEVW
jgi:predicted nucleic acid-binding protein